MSLYLPELQDLEQRWVDHLRYEEDSFCIDSYIVNNIAIFTNQTHPLVVKKNHCRWLYKVADSFRQL